MLMILILNSNKDIIQQVWYELGALFTNVLILIHGKNYMLRFPDTVLTDTRLKMLYSWLFLNSLETGYDIFSSWPYADSSSEYSDF